MDLNDTRGFQELDSENMLAHIDGLPEQLQTAWQLGSRLPIPSWSGIKQILIAGMGGSAIGGDLLAAYALPHCRVPIDVHRDYGLPTWANGPETLVIASSHSGNTEETLDTFQHALVNGCRLLSISTGGTLARLAEESGITLWHFNHSGQPRAAVGYSFCLLLAALHRLNLLPDPEGEIKDAIEAMRFQQSSLKADVLDVHNPAKRMAGQLIGRWVTIIGAGVMAPVARRWKGQINEIAKTWAQFEFLPEADHNLLAGSMNPQENFARMMVLFLRSSADHPRNQKRADLTRKTFMLEGIGTDSIDAKGKTRLAQLWTTLHLGDYIAYYLAMAYGMNPTPVVAIENFKRELTA
jgi:glucose/mannose-6-phosphate isomerase